MAPQMLTIEDLKKFKNDLFMELHQIMKPRQVLQPRKWMKSYEVREMLGVSNHTLKKLRYKGILAYTRIGGLIFYDYADIVQLMDGGKMNIKSKKK